MLVEQIVVSPFDCISRPSTIVNDSQAGLERTEFLLGDQKLIASCVAI